ncbi:DUF6688 family protein [Streptococcus oricebi]|uniref:DUF6688 family protein n=1 Tax=Streptococcus oricebi TaxID=1547447 RepID=UPI003B84B3F1
MFQGSCHYLMMKPLEWFFLLVLYLIDIKPENRIALQYISPLPADFKNRPDKK